MKNMFGKGKLTEKQVVNNLSIKSYFLHVHGGNSRKSKEHGRENLRDADHKRTPYKFAC